MRHISAHFIFLDSVGWNVHTFRYLKIMYRHYCRVRNFRYSVNVMSNRTTYFLYEHEIKIYHRMKCSGNAERYECVGRVFIVMLENWPGEYS
jgi:hypothetical protein